MNQKINNPHDVFFKCFYGNPGTAAEFLRHNLPVEIAETIDFSTIESVKDSFVSEGLERFFADLVFECDLKDGAPASIYILFEHKSAPEPACAIQVLRYMVMLWEKHLTDKNRLGDLPIVLPVIIYHGKRAWNGKPIQDLFPKGTPLSEFIPDYRMLVYDLSHMPEEEIRGGLVDRAVLLVMKAMMQDSPLPRIAEVTELLWNALGPQSSLKTIEQIFRYVTATLPGVTREHIEAELVKLPEGAVIMKSFAADFAPEAYQSGLDVGLEKGMEKGLEAGMEKGLGEGIRNTLLNQTAARFGVIPVGLTAKLNTIKDIGTLNSLGLSILTAASLEAFEALVDKALAGSCAH